MGRIVLILVLLCLISLPLHAAQGKILLYDFDILFPVVDPSDDSPPFMTHNEIESIVTDLQIITGCPTEYSGHIAGKALEYLDIIFSDQYTNLVFQKNKKYYKQRDVKELLSNLQITINTDKRRLLENDFAFFTFPFLENVINDCSLVIDPEYIEQFKKTANPFQTRYDIDNFISHCRLVLPSEYAVNYSAYRNLYDTIGLTASLHVEFRENENVFFKDPKTNNSLVLQLNTINSSFNEKKGQIGREYLNEFRVIKQDYNYNEQIVKLNNDYNNKLNILRNERTEALSSVIVNYQKIQDPSTSTKGIHEVKGGKTALDQRKLQNYYTINIEYYSFILDQIITREIEDDKEYQSVQDLIGDIGSNFNNLIYNKWKGYKKTNLTRSIRKKIKDEAVGNNLFINNSVGFFTLFPGCGVGQFLMGKSKNISVFNDLGFDNLTPWHFRTLGFISLGASFTADMFLIPLIINCFPGGKPYFTETAAIFLALSMAFRAIALVINIYSLSIFINIRAVAYDDIYKSRILEEQKNFMIPQQTGMRLPGLELAVGFRVL